MKIFLWTVSSFNEKSLNNFLKLFNFYKFDRVSIVKINKLVKMRKVVTLLTSPHVNKTAQEQFEKRKKLLQISMFFGVYGKLNKIIVNMKKVLVKLFSDIKLTLKYATKSISGQISIFNVLKSNNFKFNSFKASNINKILKSKKKLVKFKTYLKILNIYGELRQKLLV